MASLPFHSETMECIKCKIKQQADPEIESGWYMVMAASHRVYMCPGCMVGRRDTLCPKCGRYHHEDYPDCPWCNPEARAKASHETSRQA